MLIINGSILTSSTSTYLPFIGLFQYKQPVPISRATPSGWLQETTKLSRVTPFGWVQETTGYTPADVSTNRFSLFMY